MLQPILTPRDRAVRYHRFLPVEIRQYLNRRGISDEVIDRQLLGWNGRRITIPIFGRDGEVLAFRFAKSPNDRSNSPKMLSELGSSVELYGWETLARRPHRVVICEGELDRLVLESRGFPSATSTGGAGSFLPEWAPHFAEVRRVYVCLDRDEAGEKGAERIKRILPEAIVVRLPEEVGEGGDISDYFVRLAKGRVDFEVLLASAVGEEEKRAKGTRAERSRPDGGIRPKTKAVARRAERLKRSIRLEHLVSLYTELIPAGANLVGRCPFHREQTPSFKVYPKSGTYFCFGCRAHGDVIAFLMQKESMTYGQALESLESFLYTDELFPTS
jgi:DNA primase